MNTSSPTSYTNSLTLFILRRIGMTIATLLLVSLIVFVITGLLPGDAAQEAMGQAATPEAVAALRTSLGLDQPAPVRYARWLTGLFSGDLGLSLTMNAPVSEAIGSRLWKSLTLSSLAAAFSIPLALGIGMVAAACRDRTADRALSFVTLVMVAIPEFLVATIAVVIFSVQLGWLPSMVLLPDKPSTLEFLRAYAMPVITLSFVVIAQMARMTRAAVIEQLSKPYVEMARLKGIGTRRIMLWHVLPNAAGPIAVAVAFSMSTLLGSTIIVETIFNYPGLASLMVNAVTGRDTPLLQACSMIFAGAYLLLLLGADIIAILSNPRLRAN